MTKQQEPESLLQPFKDATDYGMAALLGSAITVRLASRIPSSMGVGFLLRYWFWGSVTMLFTTGIVLQSNTVWSWWWAYILFFVVVLHAVAWFFFGRGTHTYHVGRGWLRLFKDEPWADLASDGLAALILAYVSWEFNDQGMMLWFGIAFVASLGMDMMLETRDELRDRRSLDAKYEMDYQLGRVDKELEN